MVNAATIDPADAVTYQGERRRAGRTDVDPVLVPLLRRTTAPGLVRDEPDASSEEVRRANGVAGEEDVLGPSRGIFIGVILSLLVWGAMLTIAHLIFRKR
jgi:hypothetical protein